jgi:aminopeptidase N
MRVQGRYDAATRSYTLEVRQTTPATPGQAEKLPFHVPLAIGLLGPDGDDLPLRLDGEATPQGTTRVLDVTAAAQTFRFVDVPAAPVPSLLRGFSAPVKVAFDYTDETLAFLAAHDSDAVNRWDAAQRSFIDALLRMARDHRDGRPLILPKPLRSLVGHLLADHASDPALLALALALPDPAYVAAQETVQDVDGIAAAYAFLPRAIAKAHRSAFEWVRTRIHPRGAYAKTQAQMAARSLSNVCLRYLGALDDPAARGLAVAQFDRADNMTDMIAALAALKDGASAERERLFGRFEVAWENEPLVLDKWFALEARSARIDTLDRVKALLSHPRFNAKNPNRVRSLVGAFVLGNFVRFNAADGSGYAFAADQVLALDTTNPQLASTIAGAFALWKRFPAQRRALIWAALSRIARTPGLSPDVAEIVNRTLDD